MAHRNQFAGEAPRAVSIHTVQYTISFSRDLASPIFIYLEIWLSIFFLYVRELFHRQLQSSNSCMFFRVAASLVLHRSSRSNLQCR